MQAQELRDLRAARDDLERRVHDLKLTRQVTMQSLPSIRLVQENDKSLVTKINSTLVNTVPLWETQLAQAVTIQRSAEAAKAVREANDLTNELLTANAKNLRQANKTVREEMERGVFDIEAVKTANAELIATIEESLQIADEGKRKRAAAEDELQKMEAELRDTLAAAKARRDWRRRHHRHQRLTAKGRKDPHRRKPCAADCDARRAGGAGGMRDRIGRKPAPGPRRPAPEQGVDAAQPRRRGDCAPISCAVQDDLLSQGLLRTDGGGPDAPFNARHADGKLHPDRAL